MFTTFFTWTIAAVVLLLLSAALKFFRMLGTAIAAEIHRVQVAIGPFAALVCVAVLFIYYVS